MDVLHVSDSYLPRVGGIELHVRDLISHQRRRGYDARLLTATATTASGEDPNWLSRVEHSSASLTGAGAGAWLRAHPPAVVHVHLSVLSPFGVRAIIEAVRLGLPTLVTVHSMWDALGPLPTLARTTLRPGAWPVTWSAVSTRAALSLAGLVGSTVAVHPLPNAIDPSDWQPTPHTADPPTVVSVMRLTRVKRTLPLAAVLRRARADVPNLRAVIIGDGPERRRLEDYLRRHRMTEWFALTGRIDRDEIGDLLRSASLFVAPAERESFGIAALEARASGLPIVASSHSGVSEFVTDGVEGLLAESDAGLTQAIVRLLGEPALYDRIAGHNQMVRATHDWELACASTERLYQVARESARSGKATRDPAGASP